MYEITPDDRKRQQVIADAWQAIDGLLPPPLQKTPEGIDPNVCPNRCGPIVDCGVNFLFGKPVGILIGEHDPPAAQTFLEEIWGTNESRLPLLQDLAYNGAAASRAFLRIVPDKAGTQFRLVTVDPSIVFVQTAPQDCETVLLYCIEYSVMEKIDGKHVQVFYREEIQRLDPDGEALIGAPDDDDTWSIQHWTRVGDTGAWTPADKDAIVWDHAFPPIFSNKNLPRPNSFWGESDITPDLIAMNKALNLSLSCSNLVQLIYGQPIIYATGVAESSIAIKPGKIIGLPTTESKIVAVSITSDLANAITFAGDLRSHMNETSGVSSAALGRIEEVPRQVSTTTMELMFLPTTQKTDKKRCLYGKLIIDVSKALLVLGGFSPDIMISLKWQDSLPSNDLESIQVAQGKQTLGISNETLQSELGYNPAEEVEKNDAETAKATAQMLQKQALMPPTQQPGQPPVPKPSPFLGRSQ